MTLLLVVALPLVTAVIVLSVGGRAGPRGGAVIGAAGLALAFGAALAMAQAFAAGRAVLVADLAPWLPLRGAEIALWIGPAMVPLLLGVLGIASVIAVAAAGDPTRAGGTPRLFGAMLITVAGTTTVLVAGNLALVIAGWVLGGVGTFLLIGHARERPAATGAAMASLVVGRISDAALIIATAAIFASFRTVDLAEVGQRVGGFADQPDARARLEAVLLGPSMLIVVAALARSAQVPFHVWLPRATVAPVPAAALLQTTTAITGVVLVLRLAPLLHPTALFVAVAVGGASAIFAGAVALAQRDVRSALLWSTVAQTGLMFVGAGTGSAFAASFAILTHGTAKTLAYLAANDVASSRAARVAFGAGVLALAVAPASGFWSASALIGALADRPVLAAAVLVAVGLAALLCGRLLAQALLARSPRAERRTTSMLERLALGVLAIFALGLGGLMAAGALELGAAPPQPSVALALLTGAVTVAAAGIGLGAARAVVPPIVGMALRGGLGLERLYALMVGRGTVAIARLLETGSEFVIELAGDLLARAALRVGAMLRSRGGRAGAYEAVLIAGAIVLVAYWGLR